MLKDEPEHIYNIKLKMEILLRFFVKYFKLEDCISSVYRFRIDFEKFMKSKYYSNLVDKKDANGKSLQIGKDYIPQNCEDWIAANFPDYQKTAEMYDMLCSHRYVSADDLRELNEIYRKYKHLIDKENI